MPQKHMLTAAALGTVLSFGAVTAHAATILSFAQVSSGNTISATNPTTSSTLINGSNVAVTLSGPATGSASTVTGFLNLSLTNIGSAFVVSGTNTAFERFSGSATFFSGMNGTGTNYLSAVFTDTLFGAGGDSSLALNASTPNNTVVFTSSVLPPASLATPDALGFGFANVTPAAALIGSAPNQTLRAFTSSIGGTLSAGQVIAPPPVPEPASVALLGMGLVAVGALARKGRSSAI